MKVLDIKNKIYIIRGFQVMLDSDLASLYGVKTKIFNQAVKRNIERFPSEFCFRLDREEYENLRSQFVTSKGYGGRRYLPYIFTEEGVAMLSGVLNSDTAVYMSIRIMRAFVGMRKVIQANAQILTRLDFVEQKQIEQKIETNKKFEQVFDALAQTDTQPKQKIFYDGQIFDAYKFVSTLIRSAKKRIILIDNFIDDTVLTLFTKRNKKVEVVIYCNKITSQISLDLEKYNSQYPKIEIRELRIAHDRFLIIDNKDIYHFGASIKDLGKKWFAFSKFDKQALTILDRLD